MYIIDFHSYFFTIIYKQAVELLHCRYSHNNMVDGMIFEGNSKKVCVF